MRKSLKIALAALLTTAMPAAAEAAVIVTSYSYSDGARTGTLRYNPIGETGRTVTAGMGRFALTGVNDVSMHQLTFLSYCLDIFNPLRNGAFDLQSLSSVISNPIKLSQINAVLSHENSVVTGSNSSAAVQMALWEIIYESGTGGYDINRGVFRVTGDASAYARTMANGYLTSVLNGSWTPQVGRGMAVLYAPDNQTQLVTAPIPEPATWAMMIGGFALAGAGMRRRRQMPAAVLA